MNKKIKAVITLLLLILCITVPIIAAGQSSTDSDETESIYSDLLQESGAGEIFDILPDESRQLLKDNGIDSVSKDGIMKLSFFDIIKGILNGTKEKLANPIAVFSSSLGVILLCALLNSFKTSFMESASGQMFSAVSVLALAGVLIIPVSAVITEISGMITAASKFMLAFIPIFTGIVTASGMPVSAALSNGMLLCATEVVSTVAGSVLVPLLSIYMALCLIGASTNVINISGIAKTVNKVFTISLGFLLTVFVGILSLQGTVASAADSVTIKAAKFAVGAFVPVVGGAISDALNSVQGCLGLLRSVLGTFAIVCIAAIFLPTLISLILIRLTLAVSGGVASSFSLTRIEELLKSAGSVISMLISIVIIYAVLIIVSLSIIMAMAGGAG